MPDTHPLLYAVLPNPVGSDALYEVVTLRYTGADALSIDAYVLRTPTKRFALSGTLSSSGLLDMVS